MFLEFLSTSFLSEEVLRNRYAAVAATAVANTPVAAEAPTTATCTCRNES